MAVRKRRWMWHGTERSRWVVDYVDTSGTRRLKSFATKKEADAWSVTALHEVKQGTHTPASVSISIREAFERWIAHCEAEGLEYGTIRQRRQHLRFHIEPFIGGERLSGLTMPRVYQFDTELRDSGRSLAMRRKVMTNLKTAISFAQSRGLVAQNVARGVKIKADDRTEIGPLREGVDFPSRAELKAMIENSTGRWRPFIVTAIFTGMRAATVTEATGEPKGVLAVIIYHRHHQVAVFRDRIERANEAPLRSWRAVRRQQSRLPLHFRAIARWRAGAARRRGP
jgi:integrase